MGIFDYFPRDAEGNVILNDEDNDEPDEMTFLGPTNWGRFRKNNPLPPDDGWPVPDPDFVGEPYPDCDPSQISAMLYMLFDRDDYDDLRIELARMTNKDAITAAENWTVAKMAAACVAAREYNKGDGKTGSGSIYVCGCLLKPDTPDKRSKDGNFAKALFAWADCDDAESVRLAERYASQGLLVPAIAVTTATIPHVRRQFWYRLPAPCEDGNELQRINKALAFLLKSDGSVTNPASLMRLAGCMNRPRAEKRAAGRVDEMATGSFNYYAPALDTGLLFRIVETAQGKQEQPKQEDKQHDAGAPQDGDKRDARSRERAYAIRGLDAECQQLRTAPEGGRNEALNKAAFAAGQMVGAGWIGRDVCEAALTSAASACGLKADEIRATLASGLNAGISKPREPLKDDGKESVFTRANREALANPDPWVKALYPNDVQGEDGAWKIGSVTISRAGVSDSSDPSIKSPLDLIKRVRSARFVPIDWPDAVRWLAARLSGGDVEAGDKLAESWGLEARQQEEAAGAGASANPDPPEYDPNDDFGPMPPPDPLEGFVFGGNGPVEPPPAIIKKLLPKTGVMFIGGQSTAGKTFIAIYLALCLMTGRAFFGRKVKERVGVVILAGEGLSGLALRFHVARAQFADFKGELPIAWLGDVPNMSDPAEVAKMIVRLKAVDAKFRADHGVRLGAVILDTVAATCHLDDENASADVSGATRQMAKISLATGALMLPVHHYGKDAEAGLRGSSAFFGNSDGLLAVLADLDRTTGAASNRQMVFKKSRDYLAGDVWGFDLKSLDVGVDEDSDAFGSAYVEEKDITSQNDDKPLPRAARDYLEAFERVFDQGVDVRPYLDGSNVRAVDRERIRANFYSHYPAEGDTEKKRFAAKQRRFSRGEEILRQRKRIGVHAPEGGKATLIWRLDR